MIKTNLLPPELQTKKGRIKAKSKKGKDKGATHATMTLPSLGASKAVFALVLVVILAVFLSAAGFATLKVRGKLAKASKDRIDAEDKRDDRQAKYDAEFTSYSLRYTQWVDMNEKKEILASLMPEDRLLWSEKFNMLSNLIPDGVYITGVEIKEKITQQETQASIDKIKKWTADKKAYDEKIKKKESVEDIKNPGPKAPKKSMKPIITQTLSLNALAMWDDEHSMHREKYLEFQRAMQTYGMRNEKGEMRRFKDGFKLADDGDSLLIVSPLQEKNIEDEVAVWAFTLTLTTKPFDAAKSKKLASN